MPFAEANGQHVFYVEQGAGEPLLLIPGLGGDHLSWGEQLEPFSERFHTIAFDNRDSGRSSEAPEAHEIPDLARDTLGLADHLELEDFHLIGISMGGAIAQEVALAAPERVRTLTLAMSWPGDGHWGRVRGASWPTPPYGPPARSMSSNCCSRACPSRPSKTLSAPPTSGPWYSTTRTLRASGPSRAKPRPSAVTRRATASPSSRRRPT